MSKRITICCLDCGAVGWLRTLWIGPLTVSWGKVDHQTVNTVPCPRHRFFLNIRIFRLPYIVLEL